MSLSSRTGISRRGFLVAGSAGALALALGLTRLRPRPAQGAPPPAGSAASGARAKAPRYGSIDDVYRTRWRWDRVVKGTHNRTNCISACSWNLFVRDSVVWREEQNAIYEPSHEDVPDFNPRGCQKGACYSDLQLSAARVLHPLKRVGKRGSGSWKRISWEQALTEVADAILDAAIEQGSESIVHDHGTTNVDFGPDTAGEMRFAMALGATVIDSWAGVGDMPMGCVQTWGMYNCEGTSDDWFRSDLIVVWTGNPAYTRIPEAHFLHEARYRGARLFVVAPDYNATTVHADLWLPVRVGADAALALAMAQVIVAEGLFDADYVREQTDLPLLVREDTGRYLRESDLRAGGRENLLYFWDERKGRLAAAPGCEGEGGRSIALGKLRPALSGRHEVELADGSRVAVRPLFERLREHLDRHYTPKQASTTTGVGAATIARAARELAQARRALIISSWGACKHYHSDLAQRSQILLMALTGNQGRSGGGLRVGGWWALEEYDRISGLEPHLTLGAKLRMLARSWRGLTPRDYEEFFRRFSDQSAVTPLLPFLYVHAGYRDLWSRAELGDPALGRPLDAYFEAALRQGWIPVHPAPEREPRVYVFVGCNPLRRWPAPQIARAHLWPKLRCVVAVNFRMNTTALHADYVLPAAAYYEKFGVKYAQSYLPYLVVAEKAVEPLGEAKPEWEIFGRLTERVQQRARERGIGEIEGPNGSKIDLGRVFETWSDEGRFDPGDVRPVLERILTRGPTLGDASLDEILREGAVRIVQPVTFSPIQQISSDFRRDDTNYPHQWFTEKKLPWPTLSGRQQLLLDHPWYLEAGEALPVQKRSPGARSGLPLRMTGGHTRWSIHAIWRDHNLMLRLQRGEPACFVNPRDAKVRGIRDGDRVRLRNELGACELVAKVAAGVQPGQVIVYHAWEPYQFPGWKGQQDPVLSPWKAIHLAGGYGQLHYRMYYAAPSHGPRETPVELEPVRS